MPAAPENPRPTLLPGSTTAKGYWLLLLAAGLFLLAIVARFRFSMRIKDLPVARAPYRVPVNSADAPTLALLPGIGPALAARIVDERKAHGPFTSLEDLQRVRGLGDVLLARMAPLIRFDGPPASSQPGPR